MAQRDRSDVEAALAGKLGCELDERDHRYYKFYNDGKYVARTKVSTGTKYKSLGDPLLALMARQLFVTKKQFLNLVDCPMSKADYIDHLKETGHLE